jgi:hypothetical protein
MSRHRSVLAATNPKKRKAALQRYRQLDPVIGCMYQVLLRAKVPLSFLDGLVVQQHLDLF